MTASQPNQGDTVDSTTSTVPGEPRCACGRRYSHLTSDLRMAAVEVPTPEPDICGLCGSLHAGACAAERKP